jgi:EmrB/QacA subfamily drug resistance transporter
VVLTQLMIVLDNTVVNLALPAIRTELGFSATAVAWVTNSYILAFGGLLLLGGRLGDVLGRRSVFAAGLALFTIASLIGGAAPDQAVIVAARAVQGVGAAIAAPSALAILLATFAEGPARHRALGVFFAMSAAGGAIGLLLGGAAISLLSWRWVFWINVLPGAVIVALVLLVVGAVPSVSRRVDLGGAVASTAAMTSLVYGFIRVGEAGWSDSAAAVAFAATLVLLAAFVAIEGRVSQPLLPLRLFAGRTSRAAYLTMLLVPAVMVGLYFFVSQFLQVVMAYSAIRTGLAFLPMSALIFLMSRTLPRLIGRYGPRRFMIAGGILLTAATAWLTQLSTGSNYWTGVAPALFLVGLGGGLLYMPVSAVLMANVRPQDNGAASGTLQAMQQIGAALGIAVMVAVFGGVQRHGGGTGPQAYAHGVAHAFRAATAFAVVAFTLIVFGLRPRKQDSASGLVAASVPGPATEPEPANPAVSRT